MHPHRSCRRRRCFVATLVGAASLMLVPPGAASARPLAPYNRSLAARDLHYTANGPDTSLISGQIQFDLGTNSAPLNLSWFVRIVVNGVPIQPSPTGGSSTAQRLIMGLGNGGPGGGYSDCTAFCANNCQGGSCTWGLVFGAVCTCATSEVGGPVWVGRFIAPTPPLQPGDTIDVQLVPLPGEPDALPEIDASDDRALLVVGNPCNLADLTTLGGSPEDPLPPDHQLTVDDLILFVNAFIDAAGCPGAGPGWGPCNPADLTALGGPPEGPDGQITVDDLIAFVNAFSEGC